MASQAPSLTSNNSNGICMSLLFVSMGFCRVSEDSEWIADLVTVQLHRRPSSPRPWPP